MFEVVFLLGLGLIWILFAVVQDLKTREVANWLNFSLIIFTLGFRFFWSLFSNDWNFFVYGLVGFGIFFILANLLYYSRFFAGGDAKLLMALGPILPLGASFVANFKIFGFFIFLLLLSGAIYGLVYSLILMCKYFKKFRKNFVVKMKKYSLLTILFVVVCLVFMTLGFFNWLFLYIGIVLIVSYFLFFYAKALEETCMIRLISTKSLREGDWLVKNIKLKSNVLVKSSWDGLSKKEIKLLQKNVKNVEIKQGIPFVPAFLIAYILFILLLKWFFVWVMFF